MKIILLAAGKGSRISKKIGDIPKSMVDIYGQPLLKTTIDMLKNYVNEEDISIITGYEKEAILRYFQKSKLHFLTNPFYRITNSIASLWFALNLLETEEDVIIANADVYWTREIFDLLSKDTRDVVMLSDKSTVTTGDYFFKTRDDCAVLEYGKSMPLHDRSCEYVGVAKIKNRFLSKFKDRLIKLIEAEEFDKWWEDVLYSFIGEYNIYALDVNGMFWSEVDYIEDYERILHYIQSTK